MRSLLFLLSAALGTLAMSGLALPDDGRRHIALDGQANFRDIGGYETADGRTVKWGAIYRSGTLAGLSDADIDALKALGIATVVNVLTPAEIESGGMDRLPRGVGEISVPIAGAGDDLALLAVDANKEGDFSRIPVAMNADIHRVLIADATNEFAAFLRAAADPANRPVVVHGALGTHRTGTAVAILLSALGVPWETVREDYVLSNFYRAEEIEGRLWELRVLASQDQGIPPAHVDTTNMDAFFRLKASYIDAALDEAVTRFGSMEAYILQGLELDERDLAALRQQLLE